MKRFPGENIVGILIWYAEILFKLQILCVISELALISFWFGAVFSVCVCVGVCGGGRLADLKPSILLWISQVYIMPV